MYQFAQPPWFDSGLELPLHGELGTRDQANLVHADRFEELVWVGTQRGRLLSYQVNFSNHTHHLPYSRFNVDVKEERVIQVLSKAEGVLSLTRSNICFHSRGGVSHRLISEKAIARMTNNGHAGLSALESFPHHMVQLAVGSDTSKTLFNVDSMKGELTNFFDLPHTVSKIHCCEESPFLVLGGSNGQISLVEGRLPKVTATVQAHPLEVTSISSNFNYIYTCGRRDGSRVAGIGSPQISAPDVFLKIFDMRNLKHAIPVSCPSGAMKAELLQQTSAGGATVLVLSNFGIWQQGDLFPASNTLHNCEYFKTNCYQPHSPDLSPGVVDWSVSTTNDVNALLDSSGVVHFWVRSDAPFPPRLNASSSGALLLPARQPVMPSFPNILHAGNHETVFDQLPTRVYSDSVREGLWSMWLNQEEEDFLAKQTTPLRAPLPLLPSVASSMKEWDSSLSVCPNSLKYGTVVALARNDHSSHTSPPPSRLGKHQAASALEESGVDLDAIRWKFTPVDYSVNHSRFPFFVYNKTTRAGLENGQGPLDVLNPIVQALYAITPFKSMLKAHTCAEELCVACELSFLFHSMDVSRFSRNKICQPIRLCRVVRKLWPGGSAAGELMHALISEVGKCVGETQKFFGKNFFASPPVVVVDFGQSNSPELVVVEGGAKFSLIAVIAAVDSAATPRGRPAAHHVAIVAVPEDLNTENRSRAGSLHGLQTTPSEDWILFNDFVATFSSIAEAVETLPWRRPVLGVYVCEDRLGAVEVEKPNFLVPDCPVTLEMFLHDRNLSEAPLSAKTFEPLRPEEVQELLRGEMTVALDTEFVAIGLAAMEIREDGSREIGKPGDMAVGRVSVLRVKEDPDHPENALPFIDHYIAMDEKDIKDYVTRFSGIRPGDLDVRTSTHWLTSSKAIYQKLRFLLDCNCKFVGHGLHTDFRIINLWAPQSALIDTVELFHQRGQRFLSLKFLANRLLEKSIQGDEHCSIEDAKTALDMVRVYKRLKREGVLEATIKGLYESGRSLGWRTG